MNYFLVRALISFFIAVRIGAQLLISFEAFGFVMRFTHKESLALFGSMVVFSLGLSVLIERRLSHGKPGRVARRLLGIAVVLAIEGGSAALMSPIVCTELLGVGFGVSALQGFFIGYLPMIALHCGVEALPESDGFTELKSGRVGLGTQACRSLAFRVDASPGNEAEVLIELKGVASFAVLQGQRRRHGYQDFRGSARLNLKLHRGNYVVRVRKIKGQEIAGDVRIRVLIKRGGPDESHAGTLRRASNSEC